MQLQSLLRYGIYSNSIYQSFHIYIKGLKLNKKSTYSALSVYDNEIYYRINQTFYLQILYLVLFKLKHKKRRRQLLEVLSLILLSIKMDTKFKKYLHIFGFFLLNMTSIIEEYNNNNKFYGSIPIFFIIIFIIISTFKITNTISTKIFNQLYLTNQYIFHFIMMTIFYTVRSQEWQFKPYWIYNYIYKDLIMDTPITT